MIIDFTLAKCKTKATYSAKLKTKSKLNLDKIKKKFKVVMETSILLIIKVNNLEVIVHSHGELLFKNCTDTELMEKIAKEIYEMGIK